MIEQSEFHGILKAVAHSAGINETRENLNAVLFEFLDSETRFVSTDGKRISIATLNLKVGLGNFLLSISDAKEVLDIFKYKSDKRVSLAVQSDTLIVTNNRATLSMKRVDTEFPDYRTILPADDTGAEGVVRVDSKYISGAVLACKYIQDTGFIDIITRKDDELITLKPVLSSDLEIVKSLDIHIMPVRRDR